MQLLTQHTRRSCVTSWTNFLVCCLQGLPTVSMQWGAWAGSGMATSDARLTSALARAGMGAISAQQGLAALSSVLSGGVGVGALFVRFLQLSSDRVLQCLRQLKSIMMQEPHELGWMRDFVVLHRDIAISMGHGVGDDDDVDDERCSCLPNAL